MTAAHGKTALFVASNGDGHLHSTLGLASWLAREGYRVIYLGAERVGAVVSAQGFAFEQCPHLATLTMPFGIRRRPAWPRAPLAHWLDAQRARVADARKETDRFLTAVPDIVRATDAIVAKLRPAMVVFDPFLLVYYLPFHRHGVRAFALSSKPLADPAVDVPPYTTGIVPSGSLASRLKIAAAWRAHEAYYQLWERYERAMSGETLRSLTGRLAEACGYPIDSEWATRPILFDTRLRSVPEIVLHAPEFDFPRPIGAASNAVYVGANVHLDRREPAFDWSDVPKRSPLIVCALSTIPHPTSLPPREAFFRRVIEAMRARPRYTLLLATGEGISPSLFAGCPSNVQLYKKLPLLEVLRRAQLLVTHGGANSVREAIVLGVPVAVFPDRADQPGIAARVEYHRLGVRGDFNASSAQEILTLLDRALDSASVRASVARMQVSFRTPRYEALQSLLAGTL